MPPARVFCKQGAAFVASACVVTNFTATISSTPGASYLTNSGAGVSARKTACNGATLAGTVSAAAVVILCCEQHAGVRPQRLGSVWIQLCALCGALKRSGNANRARDSVADHVHRARSTSARALRTLCSRVCEARCKVVQSTEVGDITCCPSFSFICLSCKHAVETLGGNT